jgi:hypothetical protein
MPMSRLRNGQPFPPLEVPAVGGGTISLPDDLAGSYGVVLIYRGSWCPYCNAQLAAFSRALDALTELGVKVVALSVDDEETSAALVAKHKLRFPSGTASMPARSPRRRARTSTTIRATCNRPAASWRRTGPCGSPYTPATPSGGSSPTTRPATSGT